MITLDTHRKAAIITKMARLLRAAGSCCGETHLQKAIYVLQTLTDVPLGYEFILYQYGPFSFDLRTEINACEADGFLALEPQPVPYGPKLAATARAEALHARLPKTLGLYEPRMRFVAQSLGALGVTGLERLATALYVTEELGPAARLDRRARLLRQYKPHISLASAFDALREIDGLAKKCAAIGA